MNNNNNIQKNEKNKAKNIPTKLLNKTTILNNNRYKEEKGITVDKAVKKKGSFK